MSLTFNSSHFTVFVDHRVLVFFFFFQYRNCLQDINGSVESRVRLPNIEFSYVRQLQQDNSELRSLLEEHQAALQMIMTKYREQVHLSLICHKLLAIFAVQVGEFMMNDKERNASVEEGQLTQVGAVIPIKDSPPGDTPLFYCYSQPPPQQ